MYNEREAIALFEAYNEAIAQTFDRIVEGIDPDRADSQDFYTQIRNETMNAMQSWHDQPLEVLGGKTADRFYADLDGPEELLATLRIAAVACDEELPDLLKIRLGREAEELVPELRRLATTVSYEQVDTSDSILIAAAAIRLLGEWQDSDFIPVFIERFTAVNEPQGVITDAGQYFFMQFGSSGIDAIVSRLESYHEGGGKYNSAYEYLLVFLTQQAMDERDADIYPLLRQAFRKAERKVIAAICIGDYGDPRGIVLLRNYIIEYEEEVDRQLYYEAISSIKRLGGSTKDLPDPFQDFASGEMGGPLY